MKIRIVASLVVLFAAAAQADPYLFTFSGMATPYTYHQEPYMNPDLVTGDPFAIDLVVCAEIPAYWITQGSFGGEPVDILGASGTILWWDVTAGSDVVRYDVAEIGLLWPVAANQAYGEFIYYYDPVTGMPIVVDSGARADFAAETAVPGETDGFYAWLEWGFDNPDYPASASQYYYQNVYDPELNGWVYDEQGWDFDGWLMNIEVYDPSTYGIVPEPASLSLLGLGIGVLAYRRIRRRR